MQHGRILLFWIVTACGALLLVVATTTFVLAHGGDSGLVHSCVNESSGTIKIVEPNETCANNETSLDWNASPGSSRPVSYYKHVETRTCSTDAECNSHRGFIISHCDPGDVAVGGSAYYVYHDIPDNPGRYVHREYGSFPYPADSSSAAPTGWQTEVYFQLPTATTSIVAICADINP